MEKVAAKFSGIDRQELAAELSVTLLSLKRRQPASIRNWKAYLAKALSNRASSLVKKWRARQRRETSIDLHPETVEELSDSEGADPGGRESNLKLSKIRRRLDAGSYALLQLLADSKENKSRVARFLGVHRNTIQRRLQRIKQTLRQRPIENVSGGPATRLQVTGQQRQQLTHATQAGARERDAFRAQLILALASGQSYTQIARTLGTTAPTISRWKHRFETDGVEGLKAKHQGRKPRVEMQIKLANWLRSRRKSDAFNRRLSCRNIAGALAMAKTTVHRILKARRIRLQN